MFKQVSKLSNRSNSSSNNSNSSNNVAVILSSSNKVVINNVVKVIRVTLILNLNGADNGPNNNGATTS